MSPSSTHRPLTKRGSTQKDNQQKRLVRYYVSQQAIKHGFGSCPIKTINAEHLDELVRGVVLDHMNHEALTTQPAEVRDNWIRLVIDGVTLAKYRITIRLDTTAVGELRHHEFSRPNGEAPIRPVCVYAPEVIDRGHHVSLTLHIQIKKLDGRRILLSPDGHDLVQPSSPQRTQHIVDAIGLAYRWYNDLLKSNQQLAAYAASSGVGESHLRKLLPLTRLSPGILKQALTGTIPSRITLDDLLAAARQLDWSLQASALGISSDAEVSAQG